MMNITRGLHRAGAIDFEGIRSQAKEAGYSIFDLPEKGVVDRVSFFDAVRSTFPLDPPLIGSHSWNALSDSLWEGLYTHASQRIAIVWSGTQAMASSAPADFEIALNVLEDVATSLADPVATNGNPKDVAVFVE